MQIAVLVGSVIAIQHVVLVAVVLQMLIHPVSRRFSVSGPVGPIVSRRRAVATASWTLGKSVTTVIAVIMMLVPLNVSVMFVGMPIYV
jgi:hypothetical protein